MFQVVDYLGGPNIATEVTVIICIFSEKLGKSLLTARHVEKFMKYPQQERRGSEGISILRASRYIGLTDSIFKVE